MRENDTQVLQHAIVEIPVFHRERVVVPEDVDALDHVNNAAWVRFVSELAGAHSDAVGLDFKAYTELGGVWVVSRHEVDYFLPALIGERVTEQTWVSEVRGALAVRHSRFLRAHDGAVLLRAKTRWAFVDGTTQRPRRVHPEVLARFTACDGPTGV
jgi:acyl-CoA thioester hydrolase